MEDLTDILCEKDYFGLPEDAKAYVQKLILYIENHTFAHANFSPKSFRKFGEFYLKYHANGRTTWYIFFDRKVEKILIKHILNNHHPDFPELFQD